LRRWHKSAIGLASSLYLAPEMKLLSPTISRLARLRNWSIEQWLNDPVSAQFIVWQDLIAAGQYTEFGRQFHFSEIQSLQDFKEKVPIQDYES
jgi:hypothetical protein